MSALPLIEHNLALLSVSSQIEELSEERSATINKHFSRPAPAGEKGLSGSLAELDLALVLQTINNARKRGCLTLLDQRNRPLGTISCQDGKILQAGFGNLAGEEACLQMVSQRLKGSFYFRSAREVTTTHPPATTSPDALMIEAHRRLDEIPNLLLSLGGDQATFCRSPSPLNESALPEEVRQTARNLWPFLDGQVPAGRLWKLVKADDYQVFRTIIELVRSGQAREAQVSPASVAAKVAPLTLAPEIPLNPGDPITSLSVNPLSDCCTAKSGHLLGRLRPSDPLHLVHNLDLPPEAAGSPIFKDGRVVGLECGRLPPDPTLTTAIPNMHQLIWVEAVAAMCGRQEGTGEDEESKVKYQGCTEVARVDCPRCGVSSLESARFCKSCGQKLLQDLKIAPMRRPAALIAGALLLILLTLAGTFWIFFDEIIEPPTKASPAGKPWLSVSVDRADPAEAEWVPANPGHVFHNGDMIRVKMELARDAFIYVLHQDTTSKAVHLMWPDASVNDIRYINGAVLTIPKDSILKPGGHKKIVALNGLTISGPPGAEKLLFLASETPSTLLAERERIQDTFLAARRLIARVDAPAGIELPAAELGEQIFPQAGKPNHPGPIYAASFEIRHQERKQTGKDQQGG